MSKGFGIALSTLLFCLPMPIIAESVQAQTVQDRKAEIDKLLEQGNTQRQVSEYQKAIQSDLKAFEICREIKDIECASHALNGLSKTYFFLGRHQEMIDVSQMALTFSRQIGDPKMQGNSLVGLCYAYDFLGQFQKAIDYCQEALEISKKINDDNNEGISLVGLCYAYDFTGQYQKAIDYCQKALAISKRVNDRNNEGYSLLGLNYAYIALDQYQKAIDYGQQALIIFKQMGNHHGEAHSLNNLGISYNQIGQKQKAIDLFQQSFAIFKRIGNHHGQGYLTNQINAIYIQAGQYQKVIDFSQQVLVIIKQIGDPVIEQGILSLMGFAYAGLGETKRAIDYFQKGSEISINIHDKQSQGLGLRGIAIAYLVSENYQKAIYYLQQGLAISKQLGDRGGEANTFSLLGLAFYKLNKPEISILFYKQAVNIFENIRKDIRGLSKEEQKSYLSTVEDTYRNLADLLLKQDRILEAQQVLDLLKVQELSDYLRTVRANTKTEQGVDMQRPEQNIIALATELNTLQQRDRENKLTEPEQQRLAQLVQTEKDQNKQFNAFLNSPEVQKLIDELRRTEQQQNVNLANYRKLQKDVLAQMPNAVMIYPMILDDRLELILINAKTPPLRRTVNIKREQLNQEIADFLNDLRDAGSDDVKESAKKLYKLLIQPFESELQQLKIDTIIYAPDGQLRYIPLSALYDGKQWLVEKYRINNITAESLTSFNTKPIAKPHILAGAFGGKAGEKTRSGFNGLPATITEVKKIARLFPNTTTLIESAFTKEVTQTRANSHTILHLATHGELSIGTPENSFILFGDAALDQPNQEAKRRQRED